MQRPTRPSQGRPSVHLHSSNLCQCLIDFPSPALFWDFQLWSTWIGYILSLELGVSLERRGFPNPDMVVIMPHSSLERMLRRTTFEVKVRPLPSQTNKNSVAVSPFRWPFWPEIEKKDLELTLSTLLEHAAFKIIAAKVCLFPALHGRECRLDFCLG